MSCEDFIESVDLLLDGELGEPELAAAEAHLDACEACRKLADSQRRFREELRALADSGQVPEAFRVRVDAALAAAPVPGDARGDTSRTAAATAALLGLLGLLFIASTQLPGAGEATIAAADSSELLLSTDWRSPVVAQSVRWHRREVPVEVTGPDEVVVGDWFADKVEFPVLPPNFRRRANLLGGRLGHVEEDEAALLVYDVDGTKLSVLMFDSAGRDLPSAVGVDARPTALQVSRSGGYNVALHSYDGIAYTFTSVLPDSELIELVNAAFP